MKCTITIETSELSELKALIGMILPAPSIRKFTEITPAPVAPAISETMTVTLKDPDTGDVHVIKRKENPVPSKIEETDCCQVSHCPTEAKGTPLPPFTPPNAEKEVQKAKGKGQSSKVIENGKRVHTPKDLQIHCHTCGNLFHPRQVGTIHCSKRCYMIEWRETHKAPKEEKSVQGNIAPVAVLERKKGLSETEIQEQNRKLNELRKKYPVKTDRPDIERDFSNI